VAQGLARTGAGGQYVGLTCACRFDGLALVAMEGDAFALACGAVLGLALLEDAGGFLMQETFLDQFVHRSPGVEEGVERQPRVRPLVLGLQVLTQTIGYAIVADDDAASGEGAIL